VVRSSNIKSMTHRLVAITAIALACLTNLPAQTAPTLEYYRLVPGFLPEYKNASGRNLGNGFATPNPWGAYTAYLMATNAKGQRTWRIENELPGGGTSQGSTMYLLEGSERALLIDTAQNTQDTHTQDTPGQSDLKNVVRFLLRHENDGKTVRANPVDFVVANTHSHGDHTGKNRDMSDRTVYYPDLDWPRNNVPANYVPIREGGGTTTHGNGTAVSEIALGGRTIRAIALYCHTPGSTGYLDTENNLIATGDAIGSGYVWAHFGLISQYAETVRHLQEVLRPMDNPAVLPAHFYQVDEASRGPAPIRGRPLDKQYVDDEVAAAEGVLNGSVVGEPYGTVGRNVVIAKVNTGQMTYGLNTLFPPNTIDRAYHAIQIPGWSGTVDFAKYPMLGNIKANFWLIRDGSNNSLYLIRGSAKALLVGTGAGSPGLATFVSRLIGSVPLEVIVTSDDPGQTGSLMQFAADKIYVPKGAVIPKTGLANVAEVGEGDTISLGSDTANRPVTIQVASLAGHSATGLTLLDVSDRVLLSGDALGAQSATDGLILNTPLADFVTALAAWRAKTDGKYDVVYTAHNFQWFTLPAFVDQLQAAAIKGPTGDAKTIKSAGNNDTVASIVLK
jgi:glyoxylase-like metal-dependent hydrolase (beta-lactamase superfamily II)